MGKSNKLVEVVFKGERRAIYRDRNDLDIVEGEYVIVEAERGLDLGKASLVGSLVRLKRGKGKPVVIIRKALPEDWILIKKTKRRNSAAFKCLQR